jgi:hypothetical protein
MNEVRTKDEGREKMEPLRDCVWFLVCGLLHRSFFARGLFCFWVLHCCATNPHAQTSFLIPYSSPTFTSNIIIIMSEESTFLFTSESVNEGHPGE